MESLVTESLITYVGPEGPPPANPGQPDWDNMTDAKIENIMYGLRDVFEKNGWAIPKGMPRSVIPYGQNEPTETKPTVTIPIGNAKRQYTETTITSAASSVDVPKAKRQKTQTTNTSAASSVDVGSQQRPKKEEESNEAESDSDYQDMDEEDCAKLMQQWADHEEVKEQQQPPKQPQKKNKQKQQAEADPSPKAESLQLLEANNVHAAEGLVFFFGANFMSACWLY